MRSYLSIAFVLLTSVNTLSQKSKVAEPFIIQGQLDNFSEREMIFFYRDPGKGLKDHAIDTVKVDDSGRFYLKTYGITKPTLATLRKGALSVDVYAAPGYDLTLTGDMKDLIQFMLNKKITGIGSESNQYRLAQDVALYAARDSSQWYEMKEKELLRFVKRDERLRDSLYQQYFVKVQSKDKWFNDFARLTRLDNQFLQTYYLLAHVTYDSTFSHDSAASFLAAHTDPKLWTNLYNEGNLISENYISWFMGTYPEYLSKQAIRKNSAYGREKNYLPLVTEMSAVYKGAIREIKLFNKLQSLVNYCRSFEELQEYKSKMPKYIALLKSPLDQVRLRKLLTDKEAEMIQASIGKPAPLFQASDSSGVVYKLSDYQGKVVYLDLWASWCGPCRAESPHLKALSKKYKDNADVVFISVAVLDKPDKWRGALTQDKPGGLQLYDTDGTVQKAYFANSIPKFIVINKKGEIVSFDAPAPSSGKALEDLLEREIKN